MMRKYASLLLLALLLNGCDDGDITVETVDFEDITAASCTSENLLVYKLKSQESLLLQVPENTFLNDPTPTDDPDLYNINNSSYRLAYRSYDGAIIGTDICSLIQPVTPKVIDEWYAKSGVIEITTVAKVTPNTTDNSTRITGYNHNIIIKNVTYNVSGVDVTIPEIKFGDFATTLATEDQLSLTFKAAANQCGGLTGQVYNYNENSAITIDNIDASLIVNSATPLNEPRRGLLGTTTNTLLYRVYTGGVITNNYFCNATVPTTPALKETWTGDIGQANISGIIEVTTTGLTGTSFKHTIVLKQAILRKGNNSFSLGDNFLLGELITTVAQP